MCLENWGKLIELFGVGEANHKDDEVNGRTDLVDFFPVALDLSEILKKEREIATPHGVSTLTFRLRQQDSALNFVYTDRTRSQAFEYLTLDQAETFGPGFDQPVHEADLERITPSGVTLQQPFISRIRDSIKSNDKGEHKGVLLIEARAASTQPLILEVLAGQDVIATARLALSTSIVQNMYRWINLRKEVNRPAKRGSNHTEQPLNGPDELYDEHYFVMVHGCCTGEAAAEGWGSEVFKRLYVTGSTKRYVAVAWGGDPITNINITGDWADLPKLEDIPDYYAAVVNAFNTAGPLVKALNEIPEAPITIAGHSLGNMVVSSAIVDYKLPKLARYFMVDAAVAMEAYEGQNAWIFDKAVDVPGLRAENIMPLNKWSGEDGVSFDRRLWSTHWHMLFNRTEPRSADPRLQRADLTWKMRFGVIPQAVNLYSSGEEVLKNPESDASTPGLGELALHNTRVWVAQEKNKGTFTGDFGTVGTSQAGWGFGDYCYKGEPDENDEPLESGCSYSATEVNDVAGDHQISDDLLRAKPFFRRFDVDLPANENQLTAPIYNKLLANGLPALSDRPRRFARGRCDRPHPVVVSP